MGSLGGLPLAPDGGHDGALGLELLERLVDLLPVDARGNALSISFLSMPVAFSTSPALMGLPASFMALMTSSLTVMLTP